MNNESSDETVKFFWENAYRQNISKLIGVGYRYTADRQVAEDLAQDAFIIAYKKIESFKGTGPLEAWLRRIMVNVCLQYLREQHKKKYLHNWLKNETFTVEPDEENLNTRNSEFTETVLLEAVSKLPEHHKLVFNLYVLDHYTHVQIGKELGISEGTSKSHLARAPKRIKALLNEGAASGNRQKRKSAFLLFFWNIDNMYKKSFKHFGLKSQKTFSFDSQSFQPAAVPNINVPIFRLSAFHVVSIITVTITIAGLTYLHFANKRNALSPGIISVSRIDSSLHENGKVSNPPAAHKSGNNNSHLIASLDVTGTFYAEKLFWSAADNQLYFQGKTRISFAGKNYVSDSSIRFLGKVYYLVVDEKIVHLEREAKQDIKLSEKEYQVTRLSPVSAVKKYGEKGQNGAIEINLIPE